MNKKPRKKWKEMTLKEKAKKVASDIAVGLGTAYFISTVAFNTILPHAWANKSAKNMTSKEVSEFGGFGDIDFDRYRGKDASGKDSPLERKTLDWLKYANILTERNLDYESQYGVSVNDSLKDGKGDCTAYSWATYGKFTALAKKLDMPEMLDNVRLAQGDARTESGGIGHFWLEVKKDGKWIPYETTSITHWGYVLDRKEKITPKIATHDFFNDEAFIRDPENYTRTSSIHIGSDGNGSADVEWYNSLTDWDGAIGGVIKQRLYESGDE